jgi:hypothetical protein
MAPDALNETDKFSKVCQNYPRSKHFINRQMCSLYHFCSKNLSLTLSDRKIMASYAGWGKVLVRLAFSRRWGDIFPKRTPKTGCVREYTNAQLFLVAVEIVLLCFWTTSTYHVELQEADKCLFSPVHLVPFVMKGPRNDSVKLLHCFLFKILYCTLHTVWGAFPVIYHISGRFGKRLFSSLTYICLLLHSLADFLCC